MSGSFWRNYQTWMLAEVHAIDKAVTDKTSTQKL